MLYKVIHIMVHYCATGNFNMKPCKVSSWNSNAFEHQYYSSGGVYQASPKPATEHSR